MAKGVASLRWRIFLPGGNRNRSGCAIWWRTARGVIRLSYRVEWWSGAPAETFAKCRKEAQHTRNALMEEKWVSIALIAFAPAIAWLLVYGLRRDQGTA